MSGEITISYETIEFALWLLLYSFGPLIIGFGLADEYSEGTGEILGIMWCIWMLCVFVSKVGVVW